jgi:medium-chain acyl-[acyl-carrier-protein] hydrolase
MASRPRNPWLSGRHCVGAPQVRLICVPHAGAAAGTFSRWLRHVPQGVELAQVELPGRGTRKREPMPATDFAGLGLALFEALRPELDMPYVLFGHSMGGSLVYEMVRRVQLAGVRMPLAAVICGARAPQIPSLRKLSESDDQTLFTWLRAIDGLPDELLAYPRFVQESMRAVRRDLEYIDPYVLADPPPMHCPVHVFVGADDPVTPPAQREHWRAVAAGEFTATVLPGRHTFPHTDPRTMLSAIASLLPGHQVPAGSGVGSVQE